MGQSCCVWRKERSEEISFEPKKNLLAIALVSILQESCSGLRNKLDLLQEISRQYAFNHHCCYIDPTFLASRFSLIEFQSPGTLVPPHFNLSAAFHTEIAYLIDEGLVESNQNFSVIILLKVDGSLHPFCVKRRTKSVSPASNRQIAYFIVHDIFAIQQNAPASAEVNSQQVKGINCRDIEFYTVENLNLYLDMVQLYHRTTKQSSQPTIQLQLLTFDVSDEKSFSCAESEQAYLHMAGKEQSNEINANNESNYPLDIDASSATGVGGGGADAATASAAGRAAPAVELRLPSRHRSLGHFHDIQLSSQKSMRSRRKSQTPKSSTIQSTTTTATTTTAGTTSTITITKEQLLLHKNPSSSSNNNNNRTNHLNHQQRNQHERESTQTIKESTEEHQTSAIDSFSTEIETVLRTTQDSTS